MNPARWHQIKQLYNQALGIEANRRTAFLQEVCDGDDDLRQELDQLLAEGSNAASFLEQPALAEIAQEFAATAPKSWIGERIGNYQFVSLVGAGGMGEVYRARDTKLRRNVAIKILPEEFSRDPDRVSRFQREAQVLASLNHPNIAAIYDLEESSGLRFLILELVEGETLEQRLKRGPIPLDEALRIAKQIAEGLAAAHERGIIHRDLKPANIKVSPDGKVKVLDFGLAKAVWGNDEVQTMSRLVTATGSETETEAGRILGTPAYMSPEQARGREIDKRTDLWAFGCLLYELLTGKQAFRRDDLPNTIAAILEREPDWQALPAATPARIRELLAKCIQKDIDRRPQSIVDVGTQIAEVVAPAHRGVKRWHLIAGAAVAVAMFGALWVNGPTRTLDRSQWVQLTNMPDSVSQPALSPDGRMLAFIRGDSTFFGPGQVYVKILPDGEPVQLTHDSLDKMSPVFSPDGARVAYTTVGASLFDWDTWVAPVLGGEEPQRWLKNASGLVWTGPGQLLFSKLNIEKAPHMGIVAAQESRIGEHDVYWPPHEHGMAHRSYVSPDGKSVLLVEMDENHFFGPCRLVPKDGTSPGRQVGPAGAACTFAAWSPDSRWMYFTSQAGGAFHTWRQRFPDGDLEQITSGPTEEEGISMAPDGRSFVTAVAVQSGSIWLHDSNGDRQISLEGIATGAKFSPDARKLFYQVKKFSRNEFQFSNKEPGEVWIADLESGRSEPLVPGLQVLDYDLSADGQHVVMEVEDSEGKSRLWLSPFERQSPPRQIPNVEGRQPRFAPDGDIFFRNAGFAYRVRQDGTEMRKAIEQQILLLRAVSPDGRWLMAWAPFEGHGLPAVQAFPLAGGSPIRLTGRGLHWRWSADGRFLSVAGALIPEGRSYLISLPPGEALPQVPEGGFRSEQAVASVPGARRIDAQLVVPGPSPEVYAFYRGTIQRNLYRIPTS